MIASRARLFVRIVVVAGTFGLLPQPARAQRSAAVQSSESPSHDTEQWPVSYDKAVEIPATGAEQIRIVNRLGSVAVSAWDRPMVQVIATKHAPTAALGERLRVQIYSRSGDEIEVRTYVRMRPALPRVMRRELRRLMRRQAQIFQALVGRSTTSRQARQQMDQIQQELAALATRHASTPVEPSDVSIPVARGRLDIHLRVPRKLRVHARTFKDEVKVSGCNADVEVFTEEGRLVVNQTRGKVVTWTQKGSQQLTRVDGAVEVRGGEANVVLRDVSGTVRAVLVSGSIDARALGARQADLRTIEGDIRVDGVPSGGHYTMLSRTGNLIVSIGATSAFRLEGQAPMFNADALKWPAIRHDGQRVRLRVGRRGGLLQAMTRRGHLRIEHSDLEPLSRPKASSSAEPL